MTSVYIVIGIVFVLGFAFANPGFRLWATAQKFKLRRHFGIGQPGGQQSGGPRTPPRGSQRLPGDHAAAEAEAEAEAEAAWRRRRATQPKAGAKPGRATKEGTGKPGGGGRRAKKSSSEGRSEEERPLEPARSRR